MSSEKTFGGEFFFMYFFLGNPWELKALPNQCDIHTSRGVEVDSSHESEVGKANEKADGGAYIGCYAVDHNQIDSHEAANIVNDFQSLVELLCQQFN